MTEAFFDGRNPAAKQAADSLFSRTAWGAARLMKSPPRQRADAIAREMLAAAAQQVRGEGRPGETVAASLYYAGMLQRETETQGRGLEFHPAAQFLIERTADDEAGENRGSGKVEHRVRGADRGRAD